MRNALGWLAVTAALGAVWYLGLTAFWWNLP